MLTSLVDRIELRCDVLENFLRLCDAVDGAAATPESGLAQELAARSIVQKSLTEDRVFRHCAIMTQLYGLYESFAESMLSSWLIRLPRYQTLPDLPEGFKNAYRNGIARIVQNIDHRRYRHLSLPSVLEKYLTSVQGAPSWEFVNDALTFHDANLRSGEFTAMFNSVNLTGVWQSLEKNSHLLGFKEENDKDESLENLVLDLVTFRNEAAHGTPDEILGSDTLREWIGFVRTFCVALAEVITHRIVLAEAANRPESVVGVVTENLRGNIVVATCERGWLTVGDSIYFLRESDCVTAVIESLQLDDVDQNDVQIDRPGTEVGIRTSTKVQKHARLVLFQKEPEPTPVLPETSMSEQDSGFQRWLSSTFNYLKGLITREHRD